MPEREGTLAREARRVLDVRRLAFAIHDASFPAGDLDLGRGTPYAPGALDLLHFVAGLGFDVIQTGPQGELSAGDASPYDGAAFSRSTLSIHAASLCEKPAGALLSQEDLDEVLAARPEESALRADHAFAWQAQRRLLARAFRRFRASSGPIAERLREREAAFEGRHRSWLARDGLYEALAGRHGGLPSRDWPDPDGRLLCPTAAERAAFDARRAELEAEHREAMAFHRFAQWLAHEQHARFREQMRELGVRVYGDLPIGLADRDVWPFRPLFVPGYGLGAPPSRTNPAGQPWGFPVFDPAAYTGREGPGPVIRLLRERMDRVFEAYDGLRVDHPHGLVCPWVYRVAETDAGSAVQADAGSAVQAGARLFSAAGLRGHERLARHDIARPQQIDRSRLPWDDRYVRELEEDQVDRYALLFGELARAARAGNGSEPLVCEVLSTLPFPLERVMARFGLGRFRVTGKIDPQDADDPYRIERVQRHDWVMIGTHDTPSLWQLLTSWDARRRAARARYVAELLEPEPSRRAGLADLLDREPGLLAQALLAELFASRAQNVMVFFSDLLGIAESYNRPGTISPENWNLRVPPDFREAYRRRAAQHRALNVPLALALALRARDGAPPGLVRSLFEEAARLAPVPDAFQAGVV